MADSSAFRAAATAFRDRGVRFTPPMDEGRYEAVSHQVARAKRSKRRPLAATGQGLAPPPGAVPQGLLLDRRILQKVPSNL